MRPVVQFALSGLLATLLIGIGAALILREIGQDEAERDARQVARLAGEGIVEPALTPELLAGDPGALARLDRIVRSRVLRDGIVRVKLWTPDGRIAYSDEQRLIGTRYGDGDDVREEIEHGGVDAEISDLSEPENRFERRYGELLEVYLPIRGPGEGRLLFETYQRRSSISASGRRLLVAVLPALLGGLLLLQLVNLPLARSLARRLREGQREREALLQRALDASDVERRRIAADLHDGVVQDLAGVSFSLAAQADRVDDERTGRLLREGAAQTRDSVRALRTLLVEIYPPNLQNAGLAAALGDLADGMRTRGLETTIDVPDAISLPAPTETLLFRCAQEALRNATRHGAAPHAWVTVTVTDATARLTVRDDGSGFDAARQAAPQGHFGLRAMHDLVGDAGGTVDVTSRPGEGTTVTVELPR